MTETEKKTDGHYVVLQIIEDVPGQETLVVVGRQQAHRAEEALKLVCAGANLTGKFVVMPQRSWRIFNAEPTTGVSVKAVE